MKKITGSKNVKPEKNICDEWQAFSYKFELTRSTEIR